MEIKRVYDARPSRDQARTPQIPTCQESGRVQILDQVRAEWPLLWKFSMPQVKASATSTCISAEMQEQRGRGGRFIEENADGFRRVLSQGCWTEEAVDGVTRIGASCVVKSGFPRGSLVKN